MRFKISSFSCGPTDTAIHACKTSRQGYNKCVCITKRLTRTLSFLKVWELFCKGAISELTFLLSIG